MKIRRAIPPSAAPITTLDLLHGLLGIGKRGEIEKLEGEVKEYFGTKHVFLASSGKAALFLILNALNSLTGRRKVIIPAYTCFSVPSAIRLAGMDIVLCDVLPGTLDFDYSLLPGLIDDDTLCVIPTHLFGIPSDLSRIRDLIGKRGVFVLEDAAQAMGAVHEGKKLGTIGDVGFFSLGRGKNITCGSGGVIVTSSDDIAASIRAQYKDLEPVKAISCLQNILEIVFLMIFLRPTLFWLPKQLPFLKLGETRYYPKYSVRKFTRFQAGLLHAWRVKLELLNRIRTSNADFYMEGMGLSGQLPIYIKGVPYNRFPVFMKDKTMKDSVCEAGNWEGLTPMYPFPVHRIREIREYFGNQNFEGADEISNTLVTLPTHVLLKGSDQARIRNRAGFTGPRITGSENDLKVGANCR